jgi:hypothetical protein
MVPQITSFSQMGKSSMSISSKLLDALPRANGALREAASIKRS